MVFVSLAFVLNWTEIWWIGFVFVFVFGDECRARALVISEDGVSGRNQGSSSSEG